MTAPRPSKLSRVAQRIRTWWASAAGGIGAELQLFAVGIVVSIIPLPAIIDAATGFSHGVDVPCLDLPDDKGVAVVLSHAVLSLTKSLRMESRGIA